MVSMSGWVVAGWVEVKALGWTRRVYLVAHAVDDDVMVKPTKCDQVVGVGSATFRPGCLVVGLEPIAALAAVDGTSTIPPQHIAAQAGGDDPSGPTNRQRPAVGDDSVFDSSLAEELLNGLYPDLDSCGGDRSGLTVGGGGEVAVGEDRPDRTGRCGVFSCGGGERILGD
jgi:hypothetical protein